MGLASFLFLLKKKTLQAAILIKQIKNIIVNSIELGASGRMPLPLTPVSLKIKKKKNKRKDASLNGFIAQCASSQ
jgi:hypothetical protein